MPLTARDVAGFSGGMQTLSLSDPSLYRLRQISDPPAELHVRGDPSVLGLHCVAIVGTRRPSPYGVRAAMAFAAELTRRGFCIVSGLARGVDAAAHRGALLAGGYTIAVLGHGLDRLYPAINRALAHQILAAGGALVSEYDLGVPPLKQHFPRRNRIISGLSWGTIVVEAAVRSGSLITARLAAEQGREVFVVPGQYDDDGFSGSHQLAQQGAKLVMGVEDVLQELPPGLRSPSSVRGGDGELVRIFSSLGGNASLEQLIEAGARTAAIDEAIGRGEVVEIAPQSYAWIAELHPAACQIGKFSEQ